MRKYLVLILVGLTLLPGSCRKDVPEYGSFGGFIQGTTYSMIYQKQRRLNTGDLKSSVEKILHKFDLSLSLYADSSILSKVNRNEDVACDTFFLETFRKSAEIYRLTGGAFDATVGPLVKAWGFGPDSHRNYSASKIDSLRQIVGMNKVSVRNMRVIKSDKRISLDFNAIAQGYSVDVISRYFDSLKIKSYLIEIGGEVRVKGDKGGQFWKIGIDKPVDNNLLPGDDLEAVIRLKDRSLATSGNYRKFYVENGIKYSHTIDPVTGYPAKNRMLSATIVARECAMADGIATACMVMGKDKAVEFLGSHPEYEGFFVYSDEKGNLLTWTSEKLEDFISGSEGSLK